MEIIYRIGKDNRFDTRVEYILEIDVLAQELEWIIYPYAPKDMHFKAADQYGLGGKHHNGKQSFEAFYQEPKYEIDEMKKEFIVSIFDNRIELKERAEKLKVLANAKKITFLKNIRFYRPEYTVELDELLLFNIYSEDDKALDYLCNFFE